MKPEQPRPDRGSSRPTRRAFLATAAAAGALTRISILSSYDPGKAFSSPFLDSLLG